MMKKENKKYKSEVDALKNQLNKSQKQLQQSLETQTLDCNAENAQLKRTITRQEKDFNRKEFGVSRQNSKIGKLKDWLTHFTEK